jgi:hypothetical protein
MVNGINSNDQSSNAIAPQPSLDSLEQFRIDP